MCSVLHVSGSTRRCTLLPLQPTLASCHSCVAVWLKNVRSCYSLWEGKIPHHLDTHARIKVPRSKETQTDVLVQVRWEPQTLRVEVCLEFVCSALGRSCVLKLGLIVWQGELVLSLREHHLIQDSSETLNLVGRFPKSIS